MSNQASANRRLLARLKQDLAELQDNPYPGIAVFTNDANLREFCLVLTPPSGPWTGLALHFIVTLPEDWPTYPPSVKSTSLIDHPNVSYGGGRGYSGGYSPALTLRGLFLQFLTFFSSPKIEQDDGYEIVIGHHIGTSYLRVEDIAKYWPPSGDPRPWSEARKQDKLQRIWESSRSSAEEEVVIRTRVLPSRETVTETVQRVMGQDLPVHKLEWVNPRWASTYHVISTYTCDKCPYGSPALPHHHIVPPVSNNRATTIPTILARPPAQCQFSKMNDDILDELASHLPSESLISLSKAHPRFWEIVKSHHILIRRELHCFFLKVPLNEAILGIGVSLDPKARTLSSDFDWLSLEAFDDFYIRKSIEKRPFQYFLPLAFNRPHFTRAKSEIWKRLDFIELGLRSAEAEIRLKTQRPTNRSIERPAKPHQVVEVIYRMMNNIVVSLMKSCEDSLEREKKKRENNAHYQPYKTLLAASEKALISYCHLFHLLICLAQSEPAILHDATWKLRNFITKPETRQKTHTPDLGELIVILILVLVLPPIDDLAPMTWDALRGKFLEEAITRNVRWALAAVPELEVMEVGESKFRLSNTFNASKTSFRLMMFQITFLDEFVGTYASNLSKLDDNYGFVDKELPERMVAEVKKIYKVDNWTEFFRRVRFTQGLSLSNAQFCDMLRATVKRSVAFNYHQPSNAQKMENLRKKRIQKDKYAVLEKQ
ncbi:hypothetical protein CPC08DRAFT_747776 [Agrocybe pediades]|nr:hypothetical protein CPC08DRAFT_747776 [Agrocybe pediades]